MSQIFKRDRHINSNHYGTTRSIKLSMIEYVGDYATSTGDNMQPQAVSSPRQGEYSRYPRSWSQRLRIKNKIVAIAQAFNIADARRLATVLTLTAVFVLPILPTSADVIDEATVTTQVKQASSVEVTNSTSSDTARRKLALTLAIETIVAALLLVGLVAAFMANRSMRPLRTATKDESKKEPLATSTQLTASFEYAPTEVNSLSLVEEDQLEHSQLLTEITLRIRQSQYLEQLFRTTVKEVRRAIKTERVVIYGLNPTNWEGSVVAESVEPGWPQTLKVKIDDPCFRDRHVELYKKGQVTAIDDIYQDPRVTDCYRRMLEQFAVRANLVAPILKNNQLVGLMIAHQCSEPRNWQQPDIELFTQIATQVGFAMNQVTFLEEQEAAAERGQLFTEISSRIRQCVYLDDLLRTSVKEVRRALKTDRVIVFGLDPITWDGIVVAESVAPGWPQTLRVRIDDPCLRSGYVEMYLNGRVRVINDIYKEPGLTDCYIKTVEQFAVKAQLVAPIIKNNELLGLMIAHQCSEPRNWQQADIELFTQLATQLGFAVHQVTLLEQIEQ